MVSVIIPSYNHAEYLRQRIESVLDQTYIDFEVIILDDKSPDNSRNIIENYRSNPKVKKIIFNESNSGSVFKQWQKGIDLAQGEFIWIAESDDFADKNFLSKMIPILESDTEIGLVYCNSEIIYENSKVKNNFTTLNDLRKYMFKTNMWEKSFTIKGVEFLEKFLSRQCAINNASSVVFRKIAFEKLNIRIGDYNFAGDWAVYNNISLFYKVSFINEKLSYYRDHSANASKKSGRNNVIDLENYKIFSDYHNYLTQKEKSDYRFLFDVRRSWLQSLIISNERKQLYREYKRINKKMIMRSLPLLPIVLMEYNASKIYHRIFRKFFTV